MRSSPWNESERLAIAGEIKRHLHACGRSRKQLVRPDLSLSTIDKALIGDFSEATLVKIETTLGRSFQAHANGPAVDGVAPKDFGCYSFENVKEIEGRYLFLRPSFVLHENVVTYILEIRWCSDINMLKFFEGKRPEHGHALVGSVYIPFGKPFINLVTIDHGAIRVVMISQPNQDHIARGIMATLSNLTGTSFIPTCCPVVMKQLQAEENPKIGLILPNMPEYEGYRSLLESVAGEDFGKIIPRVGFLDRVKGKLMRAKPILQRVFRRQ